MSYTGSMNGTQLHFLSHMILSSQESVQLHTVGSAKHAVSAVIRAVHYFMKMESSGDRNVNQAESGFFIIMWREQSG